MKLTVNGREYDLPRNWAGERLLHVLHDYLGLTGAKFGCGLGQCGACTVLIDGVAARSCQWTAADAAEADITTIEGLAQGGELHPVQRAWLDGRVPQCGYCQAGQIMSAVALLRKTPRPTDGEITQAMQGNLCRCGTYGRIRRAIHLAAGQAQEVTQ